VNITSNGENYDIPENRSSSQLYTLQNKTDSVHLPTHALSVGGSRLMNSQFANFSMIGYSKPYFFPPPELGMVESMGSYENSSKFFRSVRSNGMNMSHGKPEI
jgi:hypothetical protein